MLLLCPLYSFADFEVKIPCDTDQSIEQNLGKKIRFYSSLQAFSNDKPRCILHEAIINAEEVERAELENDPITNDMIVNIVFSDSAREKFHHYTKEHIGEPIALMIEGMILTIPTIQAPIENGLMQIHGLWYEDAVRLARSINQK